MSLDNSIIICADKKEQAEKRNKYKKHVKEKGLFVRVDHNTVILNNGRTVSFIIEKLADFDDEHLPDKAFEN